MRKFWDNSATNGSNGREREPVSLKPVPATLQIGTVTISPATVLAPMAGVTDTVFRRFIRNLGGCGLIMTAGSGIRHSEFNPSTSEPVHLLQIWILTEKVALPPSYEQKSFPEGEKQGKLRLIASRNAQDGSVKIHQDAKLYVSLLKSA